MQYAHKIIVYTYILTLDGWWLLSGTATWRGVDRTVHKRALRKAAKYTSQP